MQEGNTLTDNMAQCKVCPRECKLSPGQSGFCNVRKNIEGKLVLTTYGYNTGLQIDPIEKKPLYHFYPSSKVLSFGTLGCNMGCAFCQNWHISKSKENPRNTNYTSPQDIVKVALEYGCKSIAFTYNDPIIFLEYAIDTAKIAHEKGLQTVAVTAGYINPEARKDFFEHIDAVNIDLKGFTNEFYKKHCLAELEPVLDTIKYVHDYTNVWMELTTLLIEGENDSEEEITKECKWIKENLGEHVPLHFSAFYPAWKFSHKNPTAPETLIKAYDIATEIGLKYVYLGNIQNTAASTTYCEKCHAAVILRNGHVMTEYNLDEEGKCSFCGAQIHGRF